MFSFLAWNVDQAKREEAYPETKWDARREKVKYLLKYRPHDLVALVELRNLPCGETAREFLMSFPAYEVVSRRYCHRGDSFQMALLVNPGMFFIGNVRVHNFKGKPANDKMVMFVDLQFKSTLAWITIGITHFGMDEQEKTESTCILKHLIEEQRHRCLVYGDFNFFEDKLGGFQRKILLDSCEDLAHPLMGNGKPLSGTFLGFAHDDFKKSFDQMSRLDHVFTPKWGGIKIETPANSPLLENYNLDNSTSDFNYPSDHLAIEMQLSLPESFTLFK